MRAAKGRVDSEKNMIIVKKSTQKLCIWIICVLGLKENKMRNMPDKELSCKSLKKKRLLLNVK